MEKGFLGVGLVSLTIFLSSCAATQTQVKETKPPELTVEVQAAPKEEAKPEEAPVSAPAGETAPVAETAQPSAPEAPAAHLP